MNGQIGQDLGSSCLCKWSVNLDFEGASKPQVLHKYWKGYSKSSFSAWDSCSAFSMKPSLPSKNSKFSFMLSSYWFFGVSYSSVYMLELSSKGSVSSRTVLNSTWSGIGSSLTTSFVFSKIFSKNILDNSWLLVACCSKKGRSLTW